MFGLGAPQFGGPPVGYENIPSGGAGTARTIEAMSELAVQGSRHPEIVELARAITRHLPPKDYEGEIAALFWWVKEHVRYVQDPRTTEWVQHPHYTLLVSGCGDCDDMATSLAALGMALGHGSAFRTVKADPHRADEYSHVYAMIGFRKGLDAYWVPVDTTVGYATPGWEPEQTRVMGSKDWVVISP
jgi:transglutaminase-like putative cysteine protease